MMSRHRVDRLQSFFLERPEIGVASAYVYRSQSIGRHWDRVLGLAVLLEPASHATPAARTELLTEIAQELSEAAGEARLDLAVLNDLPAPVARRIALEGRRIVSASPELDRDFLRDVQVRAIDLEAFLRRPRRARLEMVQR
jgi:hypothetical protein